MQENKIGEIMRIAGLAALFSGFFALAVGDFNSEFMIFSLLAVSVAVGLLFIGFAENLKLIHNINEKMTGEIKKRSTVQIPKNVITITIDEHTYLKQLQPEDADDLFALTESSRDYLREWLPWVDGTKTAKDSQTFIDVTLKQAAKDNGFQTGIWYRGRLAGVAGFHAVDSFNRTTSIGYWLGKDFQGKGIITKSCRALIEYAFTKLHLNRVEIRCGVENDKSCAVPERLGFQLEGTIRDGEWLYNHYIDHKVYGMLKADWLEQQRGGCHDGYFCT